MHPLISQRYPHLHRRLRFLNDSKCSSPSPAIPNNTVTTLDFFCSKVHSWWDLNNRNSWRFTLLLHLFREELQWSSHITDSLHLFEPLHPHKLHWHDLLQQASVHSNESLSSLFSKAWFNLINFSSKFPWLILQFLNFFVEYGIQ